MCHVIPMVIAVGEEEGRGVVALCSVNCQGNGREIALLSVQRGTAISPLTRRYVPTVHREPEFFEAGDSKLNGSLQMGIPNSP